MVTEKDLIITGLTLSLTGTIMVGRGLLLSNKQINELSGTYLDENRFLKESLKNSRKWAVIGFILISLGYIFQITGTLLI